MGGMAGNTELDARFGEGTPEQDDSLARMRIRTRKELVRVTEQWGAQSGIDVEKLVFRLKTTLIPEE